MLFRSRHEADEGFRTTTCYDASYDAYLSRTECFEGTAHCRQKRAVKTLARAKERREGQRPKPPKYGEKKKGRSRNELNV